jgi:hypothetical protein
MKRSRKLRALLGRSRRSISDHRGSRLLCACSQRPRDCRAAKSGCELPPPDAECHLPAAPSLTGSPLRQEYHAPMDRSVTSFTAVRERESRLFCGAKCPRLALFDGAITRTGSFLCWGVENAVDFNDIVIKQTPHLKHGSWRVRRPSPKFGLYFADQRRQAVQVGYIDCNADAILKSCALRLGNEFQIQESLTNARLVSIDQFIGGRIDALHPGNKNKIAGTRTNAPGIGPGTDCARRIKCLYVGWRWRLSHTHDSHGDQRKTAPH